MAQQNPEIALAQEASSTPQIVAGSLGQYFSDSKVSISLKYYRKQCECFSDWQSKELKKFSAIIEKIGQYSETQLQANSNLCKIHRGKPAENRFCRPDISPDIQFYELIVDHSNKARVHGFFIDNVFFLCWLDRKHKCFPE